MKNITTKLMLFVAAAVLCISINACKKKTTDSDLSTVQDNAQAESESNYIGNAVDAGASNNGTGAPRSGGWGILKCATYTLNIPADTLHTPSTLTINFNVPNCTCPDGKVRTGIINVTWTGRYRDPGTVIHTWTTNYTVNGNTHDYRKWVTNVGPQNGHITFNVVDTAKITFASDNSTINWTSSRVRTWLSVPSPWYFWWENKYSITGSASGTDRKGLPFTVTVTSPIILDFSCWAIITQGTIDIQPQGKALRVLDYGDTGTCDNNATVTIDGVTYTFSF